MYLQALTKFSTQKLKKKKQKNREMGLLFAWTGCIVRFCPQSFTNYGDKTPSVKKTQMNIKVRL